ncbi:MAG: SipW-dependent-type signal peptide-containing protein [Clostridia bacterium]|nr:SipW-dependent-type signal peptide-containing protein [Clostridia bacterium]
MKRKILLVSALALCLALVTAGTIAFYTAEDDAQNRITAGNLSIELIELTDAVDEEGEPVPFEDVSGVMPGASVSKIPKVVNTGANSAYVRVSIELGITLAEGVTGEVDTTLIQLDINEQYWTERDGWYYYMAVLQPGEATEPLFTEVTFAWEMGDMYQNSTAEVLLNAHATQAANNGSSALEAVGWPE